MSSFIELHSISKRFGGTQALDGVSFGIERGVIHAVMGENGAGKSTLMRILSGVLTMDEGRLLINGVEKHFQTPMAAQREGISTVYQEPYLVPYMSVAENVFLGHEKVKKFGFVDFASLHSKTKEILSILSLDLPPTEILVNLSPAEVQLVQIARAIAFSTNILLLDEPTASLTDQETIILFDRLKKLNAGGLTIIYVSHRLKEIFELCQTVTVLRDGRYVATKKVSETNEDELISMMVGRALEKASDTPSVRRGSRLRLEVRGLRVQNAPVPLKNISLQVHEGEIVSLAGLVGSGRTEVAKALFGLRCIDAGEIVLDGSAIELKTPIDAIEWGIAFVPEDRKEEGLIATQSVRHNISLTGLQRISRLGFVKGSVEEKLARESADQLAIKTSSLDAEVSTLSGGNQQKVVLAKWLWLRPSLLILDEPTRGIDVGAKAEIHRLIVELAASGVSILMISPELPEVLGLAHRIYVMRDGEIVGEFTRENASQEAIMKLAAIGN
jgi:ABC-type sugar transport system ATPase subunit